MDWKASALAVGLFAAAAPSAFAGDSELDNWTFGTYLDFYYQQNQNDTDPGSLLNFRKYDVYEGTPHLADIMFRAKRKATRYLPFGITLDLAAGKNAEIDNKFEPAGYNRYKHFRQAYISFSTDEERWGIDLGKFKTWFGSESMIGMDNPNYSRSLATTVLNPTYHFGGKAHLKLSDSLDAGVYVVNGWNEVKDSNDEMAFGAHLGIKNDRWKARVNFYSGDEMNDDFVVDGLIPGSGGFGYSVPASVTAIEGLLHFNVSERVKLGINANYLDIDAETIDDGSINLDDEVTAFGASLVYDSMRNWTLGVRFESVDDDQGFRTGVEGQLQSATVTWNWKVAENSLLRFEFRADKADESVFQDGSGSSDTRNTWTIAYQFKLP